MILECRNLTPFLFPLIEITWLIEHLKRRIQCMLRNIIVYTHVVIKIRERERNLIHKLDPRPIQKNLLPSQFSISTKSKQGKKFHFLF